MKNYTSDTKQDRQRTRKFILVTNTNERNKKAGWDILSREKMKYADFIFNKKLHNFYKKTIIAWNRAMFNFKPQIT